MNKSALVSEKTRWGPWVRFYGLLLLIFFEIVAFVFQNIEKKRLGYELSVLVQLKRDLMETRERRVTSVLESERLDQVATSVQRNGLNLGVYRWPVVWVERDN